MPKFQVFAYIVESFHVCGYILAFPSLEIAFRCSVTDGRSHWKFHVKSYRWWYVDVEAIWWGTPSVRVC